MFVYIFHRLLVQIVWFISVIRLLINISLHSTQLILVISYVQCSRATKEKDNILLRNLFRILIISIK